MTTAKAAKRECISLKLLWPSCGEGSDSGSPILPRLGQLYLEKAALVFPSGTQGPALP